MSGLKSRGYRLDGIDDYVDLGNFGVVNRPLTLEAIVSREASIESGQTVLDLRTTGGVDEGVSLSILPSGAAQGFAVVNGVGTVISGGAVPLASECALAVVWAADGTLTLYLDGVSIASGSRVGTIASALQASLGRWARTDFDLRGRVRDVRIWNRALTPAELIPYRPTLRGDEAGLAAWYPLEQDALDRVLRSRLGTPLVERWDGDGPVIGRIIPNSGGVVWEGVGDFRSSGGRILRTTIPSIVVARHGGVDVDVTVPIVLGSPNADSFIVYRWIDAANYSAFEQTGSNGWRRSVVGGVGTSTAIGNNGWPNGDPVERTVRLVTSGDTVTVTVSGGVATTTFTDVTNRAGRGRAGVGEANYNPGTYGPMTILPVAGDAALHGAGRNGARPALARLVA